MNLFERWRFMQTNQLEQAIVPLPRPMEVPLAMPSFAGMPFSVIVEQIQKYILFLWQSQNVFVAVTGSMALKAHVDPGVRAAFSNGLSDLDLLIHVDVESFYMLNDAFYQMLLKLVAQWGLVSAFLEYKVQRINKVIVAKFFWHTFRVADVQWIEAPLGQDCLEARAVFPGLFAPCLTLAQLAIQSQLVLDDVHDGRPGDNAVRKEKDLARLKVMQIRALFDQDKKGQSSANTIADILSKTLDKFEASLAEKLSSLDARIESAKTKAEAVRSRQRVVTAQYDSLLDSRGHAIKRLELRVHSQKERLAAMEAKVKQQSHSSREHDHLLTRHQQLLANAQSELSQKVQENEQLSQTLAKQDQRLHQLETSLARALRKAHSFERELSSAQELLVSTRRAQLRERVVSASIIQTVSLQAVSFSYGMTRATEYARALVRASQLIYNLRHGLARMFHCSDFEGIAFPLKKNEDQVLEFGEFGRQEVAECARMFVEAFGPFESSDESAFLCGWRANETMLEYLQRVNGYLSLSMQRQALNTMVDKPVDKNYLTARSSYMAREKVDLVEGGIRVRICQEEYDPVREGSLEVDDIDAQALRRMCAERKEASSGAGEEDGVNAQWMFEPVPAFMVDIKKDTVEDKEAPWRHLESKLLREDWIRDPSHAFDSLRQFCHVRSSSNLITSVTFMMMNRISVSITSKIHKHARIASELLFRVQQNLEQSSSFSQMFCGTSSKMMREYNKMMQPIDESALVEDPELHEIVMEMSKTYALFSDSQSELVLFSKQMVERLVPKEILNRQSKMSKEAFLALAGLTSLPSSPVIEEVEKPDLKQKLQETIQRKRSSRSRRK